MRKPYALRVEALSAAAAQHWQVLIEVPPIRAGLDVPCGLLLDEEVPGFAVADSFTEPAIPSHSPDQRPPPLLQSPSPQPIQKKALRM